MSTTTDEPLFTDVEAAVRFGFSICEMGTTPPPAYLKELVRQSTKGNRRAVGMSSLDWQAEGLLIRKRVHNAPYPLSAYGVARFSWHDAHRVPCAQVMVEHVAASLPTVRNQALLALLVQRYLDAGRASRKRRSEIALAAGAHHDWVGEVDRRVCATLDELHFGLLDRLTEQMAAAGLIPADNHSSESARPCC